MADQAAVAVIGSPSTTSDVTLNLQVGAYHAAVYGQMVAFSIDITRTDPTRTDSQLVTCRELAIGTITKVETINPFHAATALEAYQVAVGGQAGNRSGDRGDVRAIRVGIEAVFRDSDGMWRPAGTTLSNSPATGTAVQLLDQTLLDELMAGVEQQRWLGRLRGTRVLVPFTEPDFSGARGARMGIVAGATGAGKTGTAALMMACDLIHDSMGQIIIDPQAQWSSEIGMVFSLQGLAAACGRKVTVAKLSRSLRLRKDAPMLLELLARAGWFTNLAFGAGADAQVESASRALGDALDDKPALTRSCGTPDWTEANPAHLMEYLLEALRAALPGGTIYAGGDGQKRVALAIRKPTADELVESGEAADEADAAVKVARYRAGALDQKPTSLDPSGGKRWLSLFVVFSALHNLWSPFTPDGARQVWEGGEAPDLLAPHQRRRKVWPLLLEVYRPEPNRPAPWLILDVSSDTATTLHDDAGGDDEVAQLEEATRRVLDHPGVKARIIRQLLDDSLHSAQGAFKAGQPLNCRITVEEASLYATQPDSTTDRAVAALSDALVDAVERARKLGIGLRFILQSVASLREAIWKQCVVRTLGTGMTEQSDLRRIENVIGPDHTQLYRSLAGPEASGQYTFTFSGGGLTGLSFGPRPVLLDMLTDPSEWLQLNQGWVTAARRRWQHLLPPADPGGPLLTMPSRPVGDASQEIRYTLLRNRAAAGNVDAARRLAGQPRTTAAFGFGQSTVPVRSHDPNQDLPPF